MRAIVRSAVAAAMAMGATAFAQSGVVTPVGTWLTEDGRAKIKLDHCGESGERLCAFVAWMKDPLNEKGQPRTDIKNPDPAKRNRPSLGLEIMSNLTADEPGHYVGEIYNADDGKMYSVSLTVEKPEELEIRGCMLKFLCGSQTWARVADLALPTTANKVVSAAGATPKAKAAPAGAGAVHPHDTQPAAVPATP